MKNRVIWSIDSNVFFFVHSTAALSYKNVRYVGMDGYQGYRTPYAPAAVVTTFGDGDKTPNGGQIIQVDDMGGYGSEKAMDGQQQHTDYYVPPQSRPYQQQQLAEYASLYSMCAAGAAAGDKKYLCCRTKLLTFKGDYAAHMAFLGAYSAWFELGPVPL